jgi:hypothetical protein
MNTYTPEIAADVCAIANTVGIAASAAPDTITVGPVHISRWDGPMNRSHIGSVVVDDDRTVQFVPSWSPCATPEETDHDSEWTVAEMRWFADVCEMMDRIDVRSKPPIPVIRNGWCVATITPYVGDFRSYGVEMPEPDHSRCH